MRLANGSRALRLGAAVLLVVSAALGLAFGLPVRDGCGMDTMIADSAAAAVERGRDIGRGRLRHNGNQRLRRGDTRRSEKGQRERAEVDRFPNLAGFEGQSNRTKVNAQMVQGAVSVPRVGSPKG